MSKQISAALKTAATVTANGSLGTLSAVGAKKVSVTGQATLGAGSPSFAVRIQNQDANGNWVNVGSGVTITSTGSFAELAVAVTPLTGIFRVYATIHTGETYTLVDCSLAIDFDADETPAGLTDAVAAVKAVVDAVKVETDVLGTPADTDLATDVANLQTAADALAALVGTAADASTDATVFGRLKKIQDAVDLL